MGKIIRNNKVYEVGSAAGFACKIGGEAIVFGRISSIDGCLIGLMTLHRSRFLFGLLYLREPNMEHLQEFEDMEEFPYHGNDNLVTAMMADRGLRPNF